MIRILLAGIFIFCGNVVCCAQQVVPFVTYVPRQVFVQVPTVVYQPVVNYVLVPQPVPYVFVQPVPSMQNNVIVQERRGLFHNQRTYIYQGNAPMIDFRQGM
jgi:hypothetical protein